MFFKTIYLIDNTQFSFKHLSVAGIPAGCLAPLAPMVIPGSHVLYFLLLIFSLFWFIFEQEWVQKKIVVVVQSSPSICFHVYIF